MQEKIENITLTLESRKKLSMTGVESVDGFAEQNICLTVSGEKVKILGEKLKIINFNNSTGSLLAEGVVNEIKYGNKKAPLLKRVFK